MRTNRPAAINRSRDKATCETTRILPSASRVLCVTNATAPAPVFRAGVNSTRVVLRAGARPKKMPVSRETTAVKPRTLASICVSKWSGSPPLNIHSERTRLPQLAKSMPSAPPRPARKTLSVRSCRKRRGREAPSERRTATSFCRAVDRPSSSVATLAQAISRTRATTVIRIWSDCENCARKKERPLLAGSSSI